MKKVFLILAFSFVGGFSADITISATMQLMQKGMEQVQKGFMYNSKQDIIQGIETLQNSDAIFKKVDVSTFIPNNKKVRVTQNITENLSTDLEILKKTVEKNEFTVATEKYGKVLNDCVACHTVVRGW